MQKPVEITFGMLATRNKRFINFILDSIIVTMIQLAVTMGSNWIYDNYGQEGFLIGPPVFGNFKYTLLGLGLNIVYYGLFESLNMRTAAKYVTDTMVVNRDGTQPDNARILLRTLCRLIPLEAITFLGRPPIGFHDNLSKTLVVDIYEFEKAQKAAKMKDINNNEEK